MKRSLALYRKELRFLLGPAVAIIVIQFMIIVFSSFLHNQYPDFYRENILRYAENPSFIARFLILPIFSIGTYKTLNYIFAVLFLYSLLYEHFTRARYQLFLIPVRRWKHLTAKYAAILSWTIVVPNAFLLWANIRYLLIWLIIKDRITIPGRPSFGLMLIGISELLTYSALICSLVMIGYIAAICIRRLPFLVGSVTVFAGYYTYKWLHNAVDQLFRRHELWPIEYSTFPQMNPWFDFFITAVIALIFIGISLPLYEKYAEV